MRLWPPCDYAAPPTSCPARALFGILRPALVALGRAEHLCAGHFWQWFRWVGREVDTPWVALPGEEVPC